VPANEALELEELALEEEAAAAAGECKASIFATSSAYLSAV
jgi:hypothetical protein